MQAVTGGLVAWVFPGLMLIAAFTDARWRLIPNWIPGAMILTFVPLVLASGMPLATLGQSVGIAVLGFTLCFALFALGQMGGGDAKLITASLLWYGASVATVWYILFVSLAGAALSIAFIVRRTNLAQMALVSNRLSAPLAGLTEDQTRRVPYGIAIAAGALATQAQLMALHLPS